MTPSTPDTHPRGITLRRFGALFALGALGVLALVISTPRRTYEAAAEAAGLSVAAVMAVTAVQSLVILAVAVLLGLALAARVGFRSHVVARVADGTPVWPRLRAEARPALGLGVVVGLLLVGAQWVAPTPVGGTAEPTVTALLASLPLRVLYGGITEELLLRWGVMSLLAFLLWRTVGRGTDRPSAAVAWTAILASAVLFGVGHLPAASATYGGLTPDVLAFVILGNAVAGVPFGWLFWRESLEAAMVAHAFSHVVAVAASVPLVLA